MGLRTGEAFCLAENTKMLTKCQMLGHLVDPLISVATHVTGMGIRPGEDYVFQLVHEVPDDVDARVSLSNYCLAYRALVSDKHLLGLGHDLVPLAGHQVTLVKQDVKHRVYQSNVFCQVLWAVTLVSAFTTLQSVW